MKHTFSLLLVLLLAPLAALRADDARKFPAEESNPRLPAIGKSWGLDKAKITDPSRPRVLLIGDSILGGYHQDVITALDGKAYVDVWKNPYWQSEHVNQVLAEVLKQGPYDVIHFNMGLHGWPKDRIKEGTFEPLTKAYIDVIKTKSPNARIIWASSTPTFNPQNHKEFNSEINPNIVEQNRMAAKVMNEYGIPINDFYSLLVSRSNLIGKDGAHWTAPAYKLMAGIVVKSVLRELGRIQPQRSGDKP